MKTLAPEYRSWVSMRSRCYSQGDASYANYGGRGITVCERWRDDFGAFQSDMGPRPPGTSLDRIDVNGNYEPGNCRWATAREQAANRRDSVIVVVQGKRMCLTDACRAKGVSRQCIEKRMSKGESAQDAIDRPSLRPDGTHCRHGHEFSAANTRVDKGHRTCRTCSRERMRRYRRETATVVLPYESMAEVIERRAR